MTNRPSASLHTGCDIVGHASVLDLERNATMDEMLMGLKEHNEIAATCAQAAISMMLRVVGDSFKGVPGRRRNSMYIYGMIDMGYLSSYAGMVVCFVLSCLSGSHTSQ